MPEYRVLYTQSEYREAIVTADSEDEVRALVVDGELDYVAGNDTEDLPEVVDIWEMED